ncbi:DnaJ-like subfamily C member 2 [Holothuria leucospilota]|uniref:DnaJ homolog subfamily C member 2 n=1 Tax=Holothuria leucospilota TaxID=206669 RepID=A0A9Q1CKF0_HOLLE|nr:DnaJ-like subfamily C member 2 [Holothuria leucospilota]
MTDVYLPPSLDDDQTEVYRSIPASLVIKVEPVGRWFEARFKRQHHRTSGSFRDSGQDGGDDSESMSEEEDNIEDEDDSHLQGLDPSEWKSQDHYAVLGLGKLRYKATDDEVKKAYKRKVLKHHPDKKKARGEQVGEDEHKFFTCITRAYEILGVVTKRRAFDSVDPLFNDDVPEVDDDAKENFYEVFTEVFDRNERWSRKKPVPKLGFENSTWDEVDNFYEFWYDFDSWREFSYLDEEEKEKGESREERKWIEKQNKIARQKRKKEEVIRIRALVDNAHACDPRIKKFREEEKKRKADEKKAKQEAIKALALEKEREKLAAEEAARLAKQKEEDEAKAKALAAKKEKEAQKKAKKKVKKLLRDTCKSHDYYAENEEQKIKHMQEVEMLCEQLSLTRLSALNEQLQKSSEEAAKVVFQNEIKSVNEEIEKEKQEELRKQRDAQAAKEGGGSGGVGGRGKEWNDSDTKLLIKAVNLFPAGTVQRYEVIANYINSHSTSGITRNAKDVINKTKTLQRLDTSMKEEVNKKAFDKFEQSKHKPKKEDVSAPSERFANGEEKPWTADEQKRLEQALKTFPAQTPERWDKIAEAVPNRTKKECMKRYKDLVTMIKAKKAAQEQVAKSKKP